MKKITLKKILEEVKLYDDKFEVTKEIKSKLRTAMGESSIYPGYLTDVMTKAFKSIYDSCDIYEICKNICNVYGL